MVLRMFLFSHLFCAPVTLGHPFIDFSKSLACQSVLVLQVWGHAGSRSRSLRSDERGGRGWHFSAWSNSWLSCAACHDLVVSRFSLFYFETFHTFLRASLLQRELWGRGGGDKWICREFLGTAAWDGAHVNDRSAGTRL